MDIPITNPQLSANINDHSCIDDSIKQDGVTITAGAGSVINTNSGNGKTQKMGVSALFQVLAVSILCDIMICGIMVFSNNLSYDRVENRIEKVETSTHQNINALKEDVAKSIKDSKEGTIWNMRRDILKEIDLHTRTKTITQKEYNLLKEQFNYYISIGGNHGVTKKFEDFSTTIFGLNEIKMTKE